jgi:hypothetical protein
MRLWIMQIVMVFKQRLWSRKSVQRIYVLAGMARILPPIVGVFGPIRLSSYSVRDGAFIALEPALQKHEFHNS